MQEIIIAIISGLFVAVPSLIATILSNKKTTALVTYRVEQLEKKVEKHNSVMERTFKLEEDMVCIKEDIKELKGRC